MLTAAPTVRPSRVSVLLVLALHVFALMGRFTLDRMGFGEEYADVDLRLLVAPLLVVAVLAWWLRPGTPRLVHAWPPPALWALALFGYLAATAFWAPYGARVEDRLVDLGALALLVVLTVVVSAPDPARARRIMLALLLVTAVVYAVPGLFLGETNVQGRSAAFGGGPNVYIRVIVLGILAAVALAVVYRRRLFLVPIPLLGVAAVLAGSRGGIIALGATAAVFVVLCRRRIPGRVLLGAVAGVLALALAAVLVADPATTTMLQERFVNDLFVEDQFSGRPELFDQTLQIFLAHPGWGGGLDSFFTSFGFTEDLGYPHNMVLEIAATGGLLGLALLVGFVLATARTWTDGGGPPDRVALLMCAVFVLVASMSSGDLYDTRYLWIFVALAANEAAHPRVPTGPWPRLVGQPR